MIYIEKVLISTMVLEQIGKPPTNLFSNEMLTFVNNAFNLILEGAFNSDPESMAVVVVIIVGLIVGLVVLYNASKAMFGLVKRLLLFFIVLIFVGVFILNFWDKIFAPEPDPLYLILTAFGIGSALIALFISTVQLSEKAKSARSLRQGEIDEVKDRLRKEMVSEGHAVPQVPVPIPTKTVGMQPVAMPAQLPQTAQQTYEQQVVLEQSKKELKDAFTSKALMASIQDRSILTVFTYIIVSEFGVFSGVTVAAPSAIAGAALFIIFIVAAFVFIKKSYHSYLIGVSHLFIGSIFAIGLSLILGNFWSEIPLTTLLSIEYFTTPALVAAVSGMALALFMGSKE